MASGRAKKIMGLISKQKYDPAKIEKLAGYLRIYHEKGQPIDYEILIDGLKAVRRTNDPEMFSTFENFIEADSKGMEILFYNGSSNVHEKRLFFFDEEKKEKGLSGVEVEGLVQEGIDKNEKERQYKDLQKDNAELKQKVSELEKEIEELEKEKDAFEASQSPLKGILGELGSSFVESFIRRNPKIINGIPGGEALAGLLEKQDTPNDQQSSETEVNFKAKSETSSVGEEDQAAISFVHQLKQQFDRDEFNQVLIILQALADDKKKIDAVVKNINTLN
jgi:hypothetical protein